MDEDLPIEILEVYDTIEKLLSPDERIINNNRQASRCILLMLKDLYDHQSEFKSEAQVAIEEAIDKQNNNKSQKQKT